MLFVAKGRSEKNSQQKDERHTFSLQVCTGAIAAGTVGPSTLCRGVKQHGWSFVWRSTGSRELPVPFEHQAMGCAVARTWQTTLGQRLRCQRFHA
jgi:hypothetical protein